MKIKIKIFQVILGILLCTQITLAQKSVDEIFTKSSTRVISLNDENLTSSQISLFVDLAEYGQYNLLLDQTHLFSDSYTARRAAENNNDQLPLTFNGIIKGQASSKVSLTTNDNFLSGYIDTGDEVIFFEPKNRFEVNSPENELIIYHQKDVIDQGHTCATPHSDQHEDSTDFQDKQLKGASTGCFVVEIALVADLDMFQKYNYSSTQTLNHMTSVLNNVQTNYINDFNDPITFSVVDFYIATTASQDIWSSTTDASLLLDDFKTSNFPSSPYDIASLWVDRDIAYDGFSSTVGLAYRPGACTSSRYNLIEDYSMTASDLRVVFAHEIGHNFDAVHDSGTGFIMSPSVNNTNTWSQLSKDDINAFYPNATCLCASGYAADMSFTDCGNYNLSGNMLTISNGAIKNIGTISTGTNVYTGWFLSTDGTIDANDYLIKEQINFPFNPGSSSGFNFNVDLNTAGVPPGNYYLGAITDYPENITEYSETNNICVLSQSADIPVVSVIDLQFGFGCASIINNGIKTIFPTIENAGSINSGPFTIGLYLSFDDVINANDYLAATVNIPSINAGGSYSSSISLNTMTAPPGNYFLGIIADADNIIIESNENNNLACTEYTTIGDITCEPNIIITSNPTQVIYNIDQYIETSGDVTVSINTSNLFSAGGAVELNPGFYAEPGSVFVSEIVDCVPTSPFQEEETNTYASVRGNDSMIELQAEINSIKNYPNPFSGSTTFEIQLTEDAVVDLIITDLSGHKIQSVLKNSSIKKGLHSVKLDASQLAAGTYFYTIHAGEFLASHLMTVIH